MNTVLFVNKIIGFSENLFLVASLHGSILYPIIKTIMSMKYYEIN